MVHTSLEDSFGDDVAQDLVNGWITVDGSDQRKALAKILRDFDPWMCFSLLDTAPRFAIGKVTGNVESDEIEPLCKVYSFALLHLRHEQVDMLFYDWGLVFQGFLREGVCESAPVPRVVFFVPVHDCVWFFGRHLLKSGAVSLKGLVSWSIRVDIFQRPAIGIGQLIWCYTHDWSILGMELGEAPMYLSALGGDDIRKAEAPPKQWTGVLPKRMQESIIEAIYEG